MCGIFAYTGNKHAAPILLSGLRTLEYRGYDSAGIFLPEHGAVKVAGSVEALIRKVAETYPETSGIAHTRWATHGVPSEENAHPHLDCDAAIALVHNGIIENYKELKRELVARGHRFASRTDSEILVHLIEEQMKGTQNLEESVLRALKRVRGTYGVAVMARSDPEKIVAARMGSPLAVGIGDGEYVVASDASAILKHTREVLYLEDGECATVTPGAHHVVTIENEPVTRLPDTILWERDAIQKGGYAHFLEKEISEGPDVIKQSTRGRLILDEGLAKLGGLEEVEGRLKDIERLKIVACGSAYYAGLVGKYMLEEYAGIPVDIDVGSEFRYRNTVFEPNVALLAISQSGETADTLAAIREAKRKGMLALGIVNVVGSTIARVTDAGVYNHAGPEISVASTKAFLSQIAVLALFTLFLGRQRKMSQAIGKRVAEEIVLLPEKMRSILKQEDAVREIAAEYVDFEHALFMGRKYNFPIAYEGALKLKELSYIHAEGYGAGEMKHGPIAMIDEHFPTVAIAPHDSVYEKMISNIEEVKARSGRVFAIATEGDTVLPELADDVFFIPKTLEMLTPLLSVVPLQLFSYHVALARGLNVDRPRNLAKSVTVE